MTTKYVKDTMAAQQAREMNELTNRLGKIRKTMSTPRCELARALGISGAAFARTEKRAGLYFSTLQRHMRNAGAELSLVVRTAQGADVVLQGMGDLIADGRSAAKPGRKAASVSATSGRRAVPSRAR